MCSQTSLIVCPLVLSVIYDFNHEAIYYFSMIFSVVAAITMTFIFKLSNKKTIAIQSNESTEKKDVEMNDLDSPHKNIDNNSSETPPQKEITVETPPQQEITVEN